jgi:hypothetical protein
MEIYSIIIPPEKEVLTEDLDALIAQYGKTPKTKNTSIGIHYTIEFNTPEAMDKFSKDVSEKIPNIFRAKNKQKPV